MASGPARTVRPLIDYIDRTAIVLGEYLDAASDLLDEILVADAWTSLGPEGFTLGADFFLDGLGKLSLPGLGQFALSFDDKEPARAILVCGPEPSLTVEDIGIVLHIDRAFLSSEDGKDPARIETKAGIRFDRDGFHFLSFTEARLVRARIAGTEAIVSLTGIELNAHGDDIFKIATAELQLGMFKGKNGPLTLNATGLAFGRDGLSGRFGIAPGQDLSVSLYDFSCELARAEIEVKRGQLVGVEISGDLDLSSFLAAGRDDSWVAVDFSFGPHGVVAALSDDEPIIDMDVPHMFALGVDAIRLEQGDNAKGGVLWLSGVLTPNIDGIEGSWPDFTFDELGIGFDGQMRWGNGASIATTQPFVVRWNFLRLTVSAFALGRPEGADDELELRISAGIEIMQGLPAAASVEGLVVRWDKTNNSHVRFSGIGLRFGTPSAFAADLMLAWDSTRNALSGSGSLALKALDIRVDVVFEATREKDVTTLFLAAEAELFPGGIPIGTTGLCLYGISGQLAYNKAIRLQNDGPRRYYEAYKATPPGFASPSKWDVKEDYHALGLGVVIGTADDGWMFSGRGALILSIPDFVLVLTATANLLEHRRPMNDTGSGVLDAVMLVDPADKLVRLDFEAGWSVPSIYEVRGAGGGEFHVDKPFDWAIWLGQPPGLGQPVKAHALYVGKWLIDGDFYFRLDSARMAQIGLHARLGLSAGSGSFYAELVGEIGGDTIYSWSPMQLEGRGHISAQARLVAAGLTLGFSVMSNPAIELANPKLIEIPLHACVQLGPSWGPFELCLSYTFSWRDVVAPALAPLVQGVTSIPRHWQPRARQDRTLDTGRKSHVSQETKGSFPLGEVHPHSELALEFGKAMVIDIQSPAGSPPVSLNEKEVPFDEIIGRDSGWKQRWTLTGLELIDKTLGKPVELFGTFQQSPLAREDAGQAKTPRLPNSQLRLLSSRRFGEDGSLSGGGAENVPPPRCQAPTTLEPRSVSLAGLTPGFGRLSNGWIYEWRRSGDQRRAIDNRYGVGLFSEDSFFVEVPEGIDFVSLTHGAYLPGQPPGNVTTDPKIAVAHPRGTRFGDRDRILTTLSWIVTIASDGTNQPAQREGSSGVEEWGRDADKWLLRPSHAYELVVITRGDPVLSEKPTGTPQLAERRYTFTTTRAPDWELALTRAVDGVYPSDGVRPAYRDYDLLVQFKEPYLEALYRLDQRVLGVRLRDANGDYVTDAANKSVLLPAQWRKGPVERSPVESWWGQARAANERSACEGGTPPPAEDDVVLPIVIKDLNLAPLSNYTAELIAVDADVAAGNPTDVLHRWSFTMSRFHSFTELAARPDPIPAFGLSQLRPAAAADFDALIRSFDAPVVAAVDRMKITPVRAGQFLAYVLIEAPEPIDEDDKRLTVTVARGSTTLHRNRDATRVIAALYHPLTLTDPRAEVAVDLAWLGVIADTPATFDRTIAGTKGDVAITWQLPLRGLY